MPVFPEGTDKLEGQGPLPVAEEVFGAMAEMVEFHRSTWTLPKVRKSLRAEEAVVVVVRVVEAEVALLQELVLQVSPVVMAVPVKPEETRRILEERVEMVVKGAQVVPEARRVEQEEVVVAEAGVAEVGVLSPAAAMAAQRQPTVVTVGMVASVGTVEQDLVGMAVAATLAAGVMGETLLPPGRAEQSCGPRVGTEGLEVTAAILVAPERPLVQLEGTGMAEPVPDRTDRMAGTAARASSSALLP